MTPSVRKASRQMEISALQVGPLIWIQLMMLSMQEMKFLLLPVNLI